MLTQIAACATLFLVTLLREPVSDLSDESDRKLRTGIVGYEVCRFGAAFGFRHHPNVEVVAVSDLIPDRCRALTDKRSF
jgi:hypothetical protein